MSLKLRIYTSDFVWLYDSYPLIAWRLQNLIENSQIVANAMSVPYDKLLPVISRTVL